MIVCEYEFDKKAFAEDLKEYLELLRVALRENSKRRGSGVIRSLWLRFGKSLTHETFKTYKSSKT